MVLMQGLLIEINYLDRLFTYKIVGVEGATGIVTLNGVEVAPSPTKLTARIETEYVLPFVKPVMTSGDAVVPVWRVAQVVPPLIEYL